MLASSPLPEISELDIAGGLRGEPIDVMRGPYTGFPIPADAEIAIEGETVPGQVRPEGPFGEWMGYYSDDTVPRPYVNVKTILYRNDPILCCAPQHKPVDETGLLKGIAGAAQIWRALDACGVPEVLGVWNHEAGPATRFTVIQIRQRYPGHARQALHVAAACQGGAYAGKWTVVVDDDIDAGELDQVLWAMCTRFDPDVDIDLIQKAWASKRDPLLLPGNFNNRILIDACIPYDMKLNGTFPTVVDVSDDLRGEAEGQVPAHLPADVSGERESMSVRQETEPMRNRRAPLCSLVAGLSVWLVLAPGATAQSVEEFYKGKNITLIIGFSVGGGYDLYARHLARHMGKHIPGQPTLVPQNMPGAGSLRVAQYLYSAAPKDGSVFGTFDAHGDRAADEPSAQFDGTKFTWLGSVTNDVSTCVTWHTSPVKTWKDFLEKPVTLGGDGPGADPDVFTNSLQERVRRQDQAGVRLSRHQRDHAGDGARRGRRAVRPLLEHAQDAASAVDARQEDQHHRAGGVQAGARSRRRAADHRGRQPGADAHPQIHPDGPGDGAAVRGAAGHSRRPQGGPDRGIREDHAGPRVPGRGAEARNRRQSGQRQGDRRHAGRALRDAEGCARQGRPGHVAMKASG